MRVSIAWIHMRSAASKLNVYVQMTDDDSYGMLKVLNRR